MRRSSILTRQGSEWLCARFPDLIASKPENPAEVPKASMSVRVIFSLCRAHSNGTGGGGKGSICPLSTICSDSPQVSDHMVDCILAPPVLLFSPPDLSRSKYTFCHLHEALDTVVSHSQQHSELVSGIKDAYRMFHYPR